MQAALLRGVPGDQLQRCWCRAVGTGMLVDMEMLVQGCGYGDASTGLWVWRCWSRAVHAYRDAGSYGGAGTGLWVQRCWYRAVSVQWCWCVRRRWYRQASTEQAASLRPAPRGASQRAAPGLLSTLISEVMMPKCFPVCRLSHLCFASSSLWPAVGFPEQPGDFCGLSDAAGGGDESQAARFFPLLFFPSLIDTRVVG